MHYAYCVLLIASIYLKMKTIWQYFTNNLLELICELSNFLPFRVSISKMICDCLCYSLDLGCARRKVRGGDEKSIDSSA